MINAYKHKNSQRGFSLLEILIAVLILSIGLLGLAGLQLTALRSNTSAYNRSLATNLAYDIADRMRANKVAAGAGAYNVGIGTGPSGAGSCVATNCSDAGLAAFDLDEWMCQLGRHNANGVCTGLGLKGDLPKGDGQITQNGTAFTVTIMWDDARNDVDIDPANCGADPKTNITCFEMSFELAL